MQNIILRIKTKIHQRLTIMHLSVCHFSFFHLSAYIHIYICVCHSLFPFFCYLPSISLSVSISLSTHKTYLSLCHQNESRKMRKLEQYWSESSVWSSWINSTKYVAYFIFHLSNHIVYIMKKYFFSFSFGNLERYKK